MGGYLFHHYSNLVLELVLMSCHNYGELSEL